MKKRNGYLPPYTPLLHPDHRRPRTRREFLAQGLTLGAGTVIASSLLGLNASKAYAALSGDLSAQMAACSAGNSGSGMLPFLCFDLAGGANIAGSNVLIGFKGGQMDFLSTAGYSLQGLPAGMAPNAPGVATSAVIDTSLGLAFHADSAFLRGIKMTLSTAAMANINGAVIPAISNNDTNTNPHNPMYGVYRAGARGALVNLIGSENSDSGGNSMAPAMLIDISARPTQITQPSDVTGLVGVSTNLPRILDQNDTVMAMESVARVSNLGVDAAGAYYPSNTDYSAQRTSAKCGIVKSADSTDRYGATSPDPTQDAAITSIFTSSGGVSSNSDFLTTASIMKLVLGLAGTSHYAAAGTIALGGCDYHTGNRSVGETRDFRTGQCIGACLEYAYRMQAPLMLYVFSDGSLSSNGAADMSAGGRGKNNWDSDNESTGSAFFLVHSPQGRPALVSPASQQIGWMLTNGSVDIASSPAANSVTSLVDMVLLNYLALQGQQGLLSQALAGQASATILGGTSNWDNYTAFQPIM